MTAKAEIVRLSSKGQLVIPRAIREALHWGAGMELTMVRTGSGVVIQPPQKKSGKRLEDLRGCLDYQGPPLSDEELYAPVEYVADWDGSENRRR